ncbi:hypothetical protein QQF64_029281 [Cirrhinus molitorella]|uniref:Uncharacterized protein n=1 Tax=Cirrhinus molitorella TaxID=172907 RepID=A0ABR3N8Z7_9TELE
MCARSAGAPTASPINRPAPARRMTARPDHIYARARMYMYAAAELITYVSVSSHSQMNGEGRYPSVAAFRSFRQHKDLIVDYSVETNTSHAVRRDSCRLGSLTRVQGL